MNEKEINKIEEEIFNSIKDKSNLPDQELEKAIEKEVRIKNYLLEDWQIHYAIERIKEMINKSISPIMPERGLKAPDKPNKIAMLILSTIMMLSVYFIVRAFGIISAFIAIAGLLLVYFGGFWFAKRVNKNLILKDIICWLNLISWIIPGLGFFIAGATLGFYEIEKSKKYEKLGVLGLIISSIAILLLSYSWYNKSLYY